MDLATEFPGYSANIWGITSSLSKTGYKAWGGPPRNKAIDGTVVPCAPAGSLMFTPDISLAALRSMKERFGEKILQTILLQDHLSLCDQPDRRHHGAPLRRPRRYSEQALKIGKAEPQTQTIRVSVMIASTSLILMGSAHVAHGRKA
jgi:Putative glucoamylase